MYTETVLQYIVGAQECTLHNVHTVLHPACERQKPPNSLIIVQMQLYQTVHRQYI